MSIPNSGFSDEDFELLDAWLRRRPTGIHDVITLEGFLTAIVIGPHTVSPMTWLPKVWGGRVPKFRNLDEMNCFIALVTAYYNEIAVWFEHAPNEFEPTFYESKFEGKRIAIVDEWCEGFLKGMRLDATAWKPLKKARPELLKPMELFGSRAGWRELKAGDAEKLHRTWSKRITPGVREIHAYWLPYRHATMRSDNVPTRH